MKPWEDLKRTVGKKGTGESRAQDCRKQRLYGTSHSTGRWAVLVSGGYQRATSGLWRCRFKAACWLSVPQTQLPLTNANRNKNQRACEI
jgi:hypothetical protein